MNRALDTHDIDIWMIDWQRLFSEQPDALRSWLSAEEQARAGRYRIEEDRIRFMTGRAVLRRLSAQYLDCDGRALQISENAHGKPYWQEHEVRLAFNISHSGDRVAVAFTRGISVGIDIQQVTALRHEPDTIARRMFHPDEAKAVASASAADKLTLLHTIWTCKEAVGKAAGSGIYGGTDKFSVWPIAEGESWISIDSTIHVRSLPPEGNIAGALAIIKPAGVEPDEIYRVHKIFTYDFLDVDR